MLLGDRVLVVDDSRLMLEVLGRVVGPHCSKMFFASSYRGALQELEQNPTVVRMQEASWLDAGGAAVHFDWVESRQRLNQLIRRHDRILAHG